MPQPKTPKAQRSAIKLVAGTDTAQPKTKMRPPPKGRSPIQPNGLTAKQEAFALAIFNGANFSEAYREAYDAENMQPATIHRQAYELVLNSKVAARLDELHREREAQRRMQSLSRGDLVLKQLTDLALSPDVQDGARVRALELLGKSVALFTDRVETEDKTDRTAAEIERDLADKLRRLGLA